MSSAPLAFFTLDHGAASLAACLVAPIVDRFRLLASAVVPVGVDVEALLEDLVRRVAAVDPGALPGLGDWPDWPRLGSATRPPRAAVCAAASDADLRDLERTLTGAGWLAHGRIDVGHPDALAASDLCLDPGTAALFVSTAAGGAERGATRLEALVAAIARRRPELPIFLCGPGFEAIEGQATGSVRRLPAVEPVALTADSALRTAILELPSGTLEPAAAGQASEAPVRHDLPDGRAGFRQAVATLAGLLDRRVEAVEVGHSAGMRVLAQPSGVMASLVTADGALVPARALDDERELEVILRWSALRADPFTLADRLRNLRLAPWRDAAGDGSRLRLAALRAALMRLEQLWHPATAGDGVAEPPPSDLLICSGGAFSAVPAPGAALAVVDAMRRPGAVTLFHDHARLLAPVGTLPEDRDRRRLLADLLDDALLPLGSAIVAGELRAGARHAATLRVTSRLHQHDLELAPNALRLVDLPPGVAARVEVETREGALLGVRARRLALDVTGGLGGLLVDTREVPLRLPDRAERRRALVEAWERPVWAAAEP